MDNKYIFLFLDLLFSVGAGRAVRRIMQFIFYAYAANTLATLRNRLFGPHRGDKNCSEGVLGETMDAFCRRYGQWKRVGSHSFISRKRKAKNNPPLLKAFHEGRRRARKFLRTYILNNYTYCALNYGVDVVQTVVSFKRLLFRLFSY